MEMPFEMWPHAAQESTYVSVDAVCGSLTDIALFWGTCTPGTSLQWTHPVFAPDAISSSVTGTRYDAAAMRSKATISVATCFICSELGSVVGLIEALLSRTSVLFHGLLAVVLLTRNRSYYLFGLRKVKLMLLIISLISLQSYLLLYLLLLVFHHPLTLSL